MTFTGASGTKTSYSEGLYRFTVTGGVGVDMGNAIYTYSNLTISLKLIAGGNFKLASLDFLNLNGSGTTIRIQAKKSGSNFGAAIIASTAGSVSAGMEGTTGDYMITVVK